MFVEILPNVLAPIMVEFTVRLGYAVFTIVTLSFLGFGIQPPSSDWGLEISRTSARSPAGYWWEVLFDALAIASLVIGVNMIANSIESPWTPHEHRRSRPTPCRPRPRPPTRSSSRTSTSAIACAASSSGSCATSASTSSRGESFGLVGESGCGKSTIALAIVRYLARNGSVSGGTIEIDGRDVLSLDGGELRQLRARNVSMVYQEPGRALNPSILVGRQVAEVYEIAGLHRGEAMERALEMLRKVRISDPGGRDGALSRTSCRAGCCSGW